MIYLTGDIHGQKNRFQNILLFCKQYKTTKDKDVMIILGDSGLNYYCDNRDYFLKKYVSNIPISFICIQGNHEERPEKISTYKYTTIDTEDVFGSFWYEKEYPNILFASNASYFILDDKYFYVIGGAYSVDKQYRLEKFKQGFTDYKWFADEQPNMFEKSCTQISIKNEPYKFEYILTHTCPSKYIPTEMFLPNINQETVDRKTEEFLDYVEENTEYKKWFCGHWHCDKQIDNIRFLYKDIVRLGDDGNVSLCW